LPPKTPTLALAGCGNQGPELVLWEISPFQSNIRLGIHAGQVSQRITIGPSVFDQPVAKRLEVTKVIVGRLNSKSACLPFVVEPLDGYGRGKISHPGESTAINESLNAVAGLPGVLWRVAFRFQIAAELGQMLCQGPLAVLLEWVAQSRHFEFHSSDDVVEHGLSGHFVRRQGHAPHYAVLVTVAAPPFLGTLYNLETRLFVHDNDTFLKKLRHSNAPLVADSALLRLTANVICATSILIWADIRR
jgi:hypothetical protein